MAKVIYNKDKQTFTMFDITMEELAELQTVISMARLPHKRALYRLSQEMRGAAGSDMSVAEFCEMLNASRNVKTRALIGLHGLGCDTVGDIVKLERINIFMKVGVGLTFKAIMEGLKNFGYEK
jgi:hypothetical protein